MKAAFFVLFALVLAVAQAGAPPVAGSTGECLGAGYNIVTQSCSQQPVYSFTYARNRGFENPYTGRYELWPDQVSLIDLDGAQVEGEMEDVQTWKEYVSILDKSLSISVGLSYDGISLGLAWAHAKGTYNMYSKHDSQYFAQQMRTVQLYQLMLLRSIASPDETFTTAFNKLNSTCSSELCMAQYCQLIDTYGTHVVTSVVQGGWQNVTTTYDKSLVNTESKEWVSNQISVSLSFLKMQVGQLGVGVGRNVSKGDINSTFLEHAHMESNTYGGDLAQGKNFTLWMPTVHTHSVSLLPYQGELTPLYDVVPPTNEASLVRAQTMRKVIISYIESGGVCPKSAPPEYAWSRKP